MKIKHAISFVCISLALLSCTKEPDSVKVTGISLNAESLTMTEGDTQTLTATISPNNAANKVIIWSTSDMSVATVDNNGLVKGVAAGKATIMAKSDDGGKTATCIVTVNAKFIVVESVMLDKRSVEMYVSESVTLTATVKPDEATDKKITWSSSNTSVATITDGKITAMQIGSATITARAGDKTATCKVEVIATPVSSISLDCSDKSIYVGGKFTLSATVKPDNATDKTVSWSSSDKSVASVADGVVSGVSIGTATITARAGDKTATCKVTVMIISVKSVSLDKQTLNLTIDETATLTPTINPDNATDKSVTWSTSDAAIASVAEGKVTAIKKGKATITVKTNDGSKKATCLVTVKNPEYVDLGLSVKWAFCNIGASNPEEYGRYFGWGDTAGQICAGSNYFMSEGFSMFPVYEIDSDNNLKLKYDAAHVILGGDWRMPTKAEFQELIDNCTYTWTKNYNGTGVAGGIFTSKKAGFTDKSIFLPANGGGNGKRLIGAGDSGHYWSSSFNYDRVAWYFGFINSKVYTASQYRSIGCSVRPVSE